MLGEPLSNNTLPPLNKLNASEFAEKNGNNYFLPLRYRWYSLRKLGENYEGTPAIVDGLFTTLSQRLRYSPQNETLVCTGTIGSREADVQLYHDTQTKPGIEQSSIQIVFQDEPNILYYFGDGAHIVTFDASDRTHPRKIEVKRNQEAKKLIKELLAPAELVEEHKKRKIRRDRH